MAWLFYLAAFILGLIFPLRSGLWVVPLLAGMTTLISVSMLADGERGIEVNFAFWILTLAFDFVFVSASFGLAQLVRMLYRKVKAHREASLPQRSNEER